MLLQTWEMKYLDYSKHLILAGMIALPAREIILFWRQLGLTCASLGEPISPPEGLEWLLFSTPESRLRAEIMALELFVIVVLILIRCGRRLSWILLPLWGILSLIVASCTRMMFTLSIRFENMNGSSISEEVLQPVWLESAILLTGAAVITALVMSVRNIARQRKSKSDN